MSKLKKLFCNHEFKNGLIESNEGDGFFTCDFYYLEKVCQKCGRVKTEIFKASKYDIETLRRKNNE